MHAMAYAISSWLEESGEEAKEIDKRKFSIGTDTRARERGTCTFKTRLEEDKKNKTKKKNEH